MHITGLATVACLAIYVSGAAVFRYATDPPSWKRQGLLLDGLGPAGGETTRTPEVHLPTTTSITILTPSTPQGATTATKGLSSNPGDTIFPPNGPSTTSSTISPTSYEPTPTRTHIPPPSVKPAAFLSTPPGTLTDFTSMHPTVPDMTSTTSWISTASPSPTSSAAPSSATSTNSVWKTVGIAVSVVTMIGLTVLLVVFFEQWTAFVKDVFLCRRSRSDQDPLGDEEFLPDKHYENYDTGIGSHDRGWAREIRESARLSNIRYPTDVFYGGGSTLGPGKAGIGAGGGAGRRVGEFGQLDRPSRPSFLQRLSVLSLRPPPVSPRLRMKGYSPGIENTGDGSPASTLCPPKLSAY